MKIYTLALLILSLQAQAEIDLSFRLADYIQKFKATPQVGFVSETKFTAQSLLLINLPQAKSAVPDKKILISPKIIQLAQLNRIAIEPAKVIFATNKIPTIPPVIPLAKIAEPKIKNSEPKLMELINIQNDEYKMIQAQIYFEMLKKYDVALSLFTELIEVARFKQQALMQYAESANFLGLYSEYRQKMLQAVDETKDKSIKNQALESITRNIKNLETTDMERIEPLVQSSNININNNSHYLYKQAKYYLKHGDFSSAEIALDNISTKSDVYLDSILLSSSLNYRKGDVKAAISKLEKVVPTIENLKKSKIRNILILTLARLYFQKAKYKESYAHYLKIDKSSSFWLQAMVEQAWAQILVGDHIGAAGNMFSLHTEYFKKSFVPESYIVRSVGYLNLCQYGDALHVLTDLHGRFEQTHEKLLKYQKENKESVAYYDLVKSWFKNATQNDLGNIPKAFVAELASNPAFTSIQKQINNYEEENTKFNKMIAEYTAREQQVKQKIQVLKNEVPTLKNQHASNDLLMQNEINTLALDLELQAINRGKEGVKKMRDRAQVRLESEKIVLRKQAALVIKNKFDESVTALTKLLEQEEILAYEIYSGAGEHIRYQMAGGKANERTPATLTPEEKTSYKWKFRGEVWEDEIGHYRSSLKNVCANENIAQTKGDQ